MEEATIFKINAGRSFSLVGLKDYVSAFSILQDENHRFVTDSDIARWNGNSSSGSSGSLIVLDNYYTKSGSDARFKPISFQPGWLDVTGKPLTFPPAPHQHSVEDIAGLSGSFYTKTESDSKYKSSNYVPAYSDIIGKPSTFPATAHTHSINDTSDLANILDSKVDKVSGSGLSSNDYTTAEKNKLASINLGGSGSYISQRKVFILSNGLNQTFSHDYNLLPDYDLLGTDGNEITAQVKRTNTTIQILTNQSIEGATLIVKT